MDVAKAACFLMFFLCFRASVADQARDGGGLVHRYILRDGGQLANVEGSATERQEDRDVIRASANREGRKCKPTYGVMPCTHTVIGNLFLVILYGYILYCAARLLADGSELLLAVLKTGIIGGLVLPVLGSLPDSILVFVSGLDSDKAAAQQEILIGIGLLAGSIVMLLTLLWGICLVYGRCDLVLQDGKMIAIDKRNDKGCHLKETGIETDDLTKYSARIMMCTITPFILVQIPKIFHFPDKASNIFILAACIMSFCGLAAYCIYQVLSPWIQERRKLRAQKMAYKLLALEKFMMTVRHNEVLFDRKGQLNEEMATKVFERLDVDNDRRISWTELRAILTVAGSMDDVQIKKVMADFDKRDPLNYITLDEFIDELKRWSKELKLKFQDTVPQKREKVQAFLDSLKLTEYDEDSEGKPPSKWEVVRKGVLLLIVGAALAAVFANPLVDAVDEFSSASHIPSFFVSFVLLPIASNASEAVTSIVFASRKKKVNMSLTYSQIYGAVSMNCTMGLGIFLALVYGRGLMWKFSSEVVVICFVVVVMGLLGSFRSIFPLWMAGIALSLYPVSLGVVAILDYLVGWE